VQATRVSQRGVEQVTSDQSARGREAQPPVRGPAVLAA